MGMRDTYKIGQQQYLFRTLS